MAANRHHYGYLPEQAQEDALHATRLLSVEERPLLRVTKSLLNRDSLIRKLPIHLPSPPPEVDDVVEPPTAASEIDEFTRAKYREDTLLDFAALESSIVRMQFLLSSNERERAHYAEQKARILSTAQSVRENTLELRQQLVEAQRVLERRKGYDELAGKILDDKKIKSREECKAEIEALEKECEDLKVESVEFEGIWTGRNEQFTKIVAECEAMSRLIKGIKEEPEHDGDEDMDDGEDRNTKGENSRLGTPTPGGRTPMPNDTAAHTPMPEHDDAEESATHEHKLLGVEGVSHTAHNISSPFRRAHEVPPDVEMAESADESAPLSNDLRDSNASAQPEIAPATMLETMDET